MRSRSAKVSGPRWGYNGNAEKPSFTPSELVTYNGRDAGIDGAPPTVCHSLVTDRRIQFLSDCTHALAEQTVDQAHGASISEAREQAATKTFNRAPAAVNTEESARRAPVVRRADCLRRSTPPRIVTDTSYMSFRAISYTLLSKELTNDPGNKADGDKTVNEIEDLNAR